MQKYVQQLLADLKAARKIKPKTPDYKTLYPNHPAWDYGLDYVVEWEMAPERTMEDLFGIAPMAFPPEDKLSDPQVKKIAIAILKLWESHHIEASFPETAPYRLVYKVLVQCWQEETLNYSAHGDTCIHICNHNLDYCVWGQEHCTCKEYAEDWKDFDQSSTSPTSELPF